MKNRCYDKDTKQFICFENGMYYFEKTPSQILRLKTSQKEYFWDIAKLFLAIILNNDIYESDKVEFTYFDTFKNKFEIKGTVLYKDGKFYIHTNDYNYDISLLFRATKLTVIKNKKEHK